MTMNIYIYIPIIICIETCIYIYIYNKILPRAQLNDTVKESSNVGRVSSC